MRVALLGPWPDGGSRLGVSVHMESLARELAEHHDLQVNIVTVSEKFGQGESRDRCLRIHRVWSPTIPATLWAPSLGGLSLVSLVQRLQPEVVHGVMSGAPYGLATAVLASDFPTVLTVHSLTSQRAILPPTAKRLLHDTLWSAFEWFQLQRVRHIICVAPHLAAAVRARSASRVHNIPNGVGEDWFTVREAQVPGAILFVGRLNRIKGLHILIQSLGLVRRELPHVRLSVVGPMEDPTYLREIRELISMKGLDGHVSFLGPLDQEGVLREMASCEILAMPSLDEGMPLALLEAMAAGKPVVATHVGGIPTVVQDSWNGLLVPPGNPLPLSRALRRVLEDPVLRTRLGSHARQAASEYTWKRMASKVLRVYRAAVLDAG